MERSVQIPFAIPIEKPILQGANGPLYLSSKIKTCYKDLGNTKGFKWYTGVITDGKKCYTSEGNTLCNKYNDNSITDVTNNLVNNIRFRFREDFNKTVYKFHIASH